MARIVRIVGAPASGKSTLRASLGRELGIPTYGIDEFRLRLMGPRDAWPPDDALAWRMLRQAIGRQSACIAETSGLSPRDNVLYAGHQAFVVLVVEQAWVRRQRLIERARSGHPLARTRDYVRRVANLPEPLVRPDAIWRAGDDLTALAMRIRDWLSPASVGVAR